MARTVMKLLYRIKENKILYNKHSSETLLIFCSLLRYYAANIVKTFLNFIIIFNFNYQNYIIFIIYKILKNRVKLIKML